MDSRERQVGFSVKFANDSVPSFSLNGETALLLGCIMSIQGAALVAVLVSRKAASRQKHSPDARSTGRQKLPVRRLPVRSEPAKIS
jgi:hypothetical protein